MALTKYVYQTIDLSALIAANNGVFERTDSQDPPGTLSLGLPTGTTLRVSSNFRSLAVLSRTYEGSGTVISNDGLAGDGTLISGTWATDVDNTVYLKNPRIQYAHHASMVGVEKTTDQPQVNVSGAMSIRNPVGAGVLLDKPGLIQFKYLANGGLGIDKIFEAIPGKKGSETQQTIGIESDPHLVDDGFWHVAGFAIRNNTWQIYVDGNLVKEKTNIDYASQLDPGNPLFIGNSREGTAQYTGDMDVIVYMSSGAASSFFSDIDPSSGNWTSSVQDLGSGNAWILDSVTNGGYLNSEHSASVNVKLSDTSVFLQVQEASLNFKVRYIPPLSFLDRVLYAGETEDYIFGRFAQFIINLSRGQSKYSPNLSNIKVTFRRRE